MLLAIVLESLANGEPRRRSTLSASLGLSAAELDAALAELAATGLDVIYDAPGEVQLARALDWIDPAAIESRLGAATRHRIQLLERHVVLESTNRYLLDAPAPPCRQARIAIAEYQHGGRGRRGRQWCMPPAAGIALSVAWSFAQRPAALPALSLAMGAVARRALLEVAGIETGLKWPNDLIVADRKLGGILIELGATGDGGCHVVAGIGINFDVPPAYLQTVASWRHGAIDLLSAIAPEHIGRTAVAAALIEHIVELFASFADSGFAPYRREWLRAHVLDGAAVELETPQQVERGTVCGVGEDGALIVETADGGRRRFISGDVTVRPSP